MALNHLEDQSHSEDQNHSEDHNHSEDQSLSEDINHQEDQHFEKQKVKVEKDEKPLMAWTWTNSKIECSRTFSLTVLTRIGGYFF